jgi:hypothetical protein
MKWPAFTVGVMTLIATGMVAAQANEGKTGAGARGTCLGLARWTVAKQAV